MANIYTIYNSENQRIGQTPIRRQAENAALGYAKRLGGGRRSLTASVLKMATRAGCNSTRMARWFCSGTAARFGRG